MCTIQENNNKNLVIELTPQVVAGKGLLFLLNDTDVDVDNIKSAIHNANKSGVLNSIDSKLMAKDIADIESTLDIIKHHYNIGRQVTAAKTNHLNALKTLVK